jgi:hypothetical protein
MPYESGAQESDFANLPRTEIMQGGRALLTDFIESDGAVLVDDFISQILERDSSVIVKTVLVRDYSEIAGKNHDFYNAKSGQITITVFKIAPEMTNPPKILKDDIARVNSEIIWTYLHESRHLKNAKISLAGLNSRQIMDFMFFDEISARCAELLFCRDIYLKTKSVKIAFASKKYEISGLSPAGSKITETVYVSETYQKYADYLSKGKIQNKITKDEAIKMMQFALVGFTDRDNVPLYSQTMPLLIAHRMQSAYRDYLLFVAEKSAKMNSFESAMRAAFDFDGVNFYDLAGAREFEKIIPGFSKIKDNKKFKTRFANFAKDFPDMIDGQYSAINRTDSIYQLLQRQQ